MKILLSQDLLTSILQPIDPDHAPIADWFFEQQHDPKAPLQPYVTTTTLAAIEADARASGRRDMVDALKDLAEGLIAQERVIPIDRSISERFGRHLEKLAVTGITDFDTLDIIDTAAAVDVGCYFGIAESDVTTALEIDGLTIFHPQPSEVGC